MEFIRPTIALPDRHMEYLVALPMEASFKFTEESDVSKVQPMVVAVYVPTGINSKSEYEYKFSGVRIK